MLFARLRARFGVLQNEWAYTLLAGLGLSCFALFSGVALEWLQADLESVFAGGFYVMLLFIFLEKLQDGYKQRFE